MNGGEALLGGVGAKPAADAVGGGSDDPTLGMIADLFGAGPSFLVNRDPQRALGVALMTAAAAAGLPNISGLINSPGGISQPTPINQPNDNRYRNRWFV